MQDKYEKVGLNIGCGLNPLPTTDKELWINIDYFEELGNVFKSKYKDQKILFEHFNLDTDQLVITSFYQQSGFFERYGKFNQVLMNDVFQHLAKPLKVMYDVWLSCKNGALVMISCPYQNSRLAWADIGHRREINEITLLSLTDEFYKKNFKMNTSFTPYRLKYPFSFEKVDLDLKAEQGSISLVSIVLRVIKK